MDGLFDGISLPVLDFAKELTEVRRRRQRFEDLGFGTILGCALATAIAVIISLLGWKDFIVFAPAPIGGLWFLSCFYLKHRIEGCERRLANLEATLENCLGAWVFDLQTLPGSVFVLTLERDGNCELIHSSCQTIQEELRTRFAGRLLVAQISSRLEQSADLSCCFPPVISSLSYNLGEPGLPHLDSVLFMLERVREREACVVSYN